MCEINLLTLVLASKIECVLPKKSVIPFLSETCGHSSNAVDLQSSGNVNLSV